MKPTVIIMRGTSGAGKSTYVRKHLPKAVVCSADDFLRDGQGCYRFDRSKLAHAHRSCRRVFERALARRAPLIVVDNMHLRRAWYADYVERARAEGYRVMQRPMHGHHQNVHGTPARKVAEMRGWFEEDATLPVYHRIIEVSLADRERFDGFVPTRGSDCWEWAGSLTHEGYGQFTLGGRTEQAHRASLMMEGVDLEGQVVMHECDNRACVRPDHLRWGSQAANLRDMRRRGRAPYSGGRCASHEEVRTIRRLRSQGRDFDEIARRLRISQRLVEELWATGSSG